MPVKIFFCYAHKDETLLTELKTHLSPLWREGLIEVWYDRDISAGMQWEQQIKEQLNSSQIILLLISPDFMASDYINNVELKQALERDKRGEARVIPVILRPVYWKGVLGRLQALPTDGRPVVDRYWQSVDEAFFNVIEGVRKVIEHMEPPPELQPRRPFEKAQEEERAKPLFSIKPEEFSLLSTLPAHSDYVRSVAFSPDGQMLASGSADKTTKLWNPHTGVELRTLSEQRSIYSVAFSPDGQMLASGSVDKTTKLWNPHTGVELRTLKGHSSDIRSVAFSPDGQVFASSSDEGPLSCGTHIQEWGCVPQRASHIVSVLLFAPMGRCCQWELGQDHQAVEPTYRRELRTLKVD